MEKYKLTKYSCYTANASMSVVSALTPLLFLTFHNLYGITYTMLGALVLINFSTQLFVDLIFSFYSHKFNITKMVKIIPILTFIGLIVYAVFPFLFPNAVYLGLVIGTVIFASSGGLVEVLLSPVIAEIPSENPEREMSKLHSVYAWGVVGVVIISSLFLLVFGKENWQWLALIWAIIPLISAILFSRAEIPSLKTPEKASKVFKLFKSKSFLICFFCIFFGGASECTMSQWSSSYIEQALGIPKIWGDIFGVALFAVMLGLGRTLYTKFGKNIYKVLLLGAMGATVCYITAAISNIPLVGLFSCAITGFCTAMLWPGSLIVASNKFQTSGVAIFALMAAGGDLGGAVGPQLVGTVTDLAIKSSYFIPIANSLNLTTEQLGLKIGLVSATIFPLIATILFAVIYKNYNKCKK
ncbi:MAG: MFS transporter [Oscillospiraceae bacterium]